MQSINLSYDYIATFFLFMIIIWYITEKKVPLKSFKLFFYVILSAFMASFLETFGYLIVKNSNIIPIKYAFITTSFQMLFVHSFIAMLTYCLLNMVHINIRTNKKLISFFIVIELLIFLLTIPNLFIPNWSFDLPDGKYVATGIGNFLYIIDAVMISVCFWVIIKKGNELKFIKTSIIIFIIIIGIVCATIQLLFFIPMLNMVLATFCMVMYLFQQSPDAYTDEITQLFNRTLLGEYLQEKFIVKKSFSIIVVDLVGFRQINQSFGVTSGNELLYEVGKFLSKIHTSNKIFRFDADQFCIIVDKNDKDAFSIVETIENRFKHSWHINNHDLILKATGCIIDCPDNAAHYNELLEVITYSMDVVKSINKGSFSYARDLDLNKIEEIRIIEKTVKNAIYNKSVQVYFQPLFSTADNCYNAAEALVRIKDETLGFIPPDLFIPIAERSGMINELGEMIFEDVCRFIQNNQLDKTPIKYIDINVSPVELIQQDYAKRILKTLKKYEILPSQINIEITETAMMNTLPIVKQNIQLLVTNGIKISLDDYGSGYANINNINKMPFSFIKIDKELIWEAFKNNKARITLEHTINMMNDLNLKIVAEGVETEEMCHLLTEFGCSHLQGWYFSKALSEKDFIQLLKEKDQ